MKGNGMPGRLKKKPEYNPELQFNSKRQIEPILKQRSLCEIIG